MRLQTLILIMATVTGALWILPAWVIGVCYKPELTQSQLLREYWPEQGIGVAVILLGCWLSRFAK